jgi:hypothetical protein
MSARAQRRCAVCGASLDGRRRDAVYCSPGCRREQGRIRAVLAGRSDGPYSTLADLAERRQSRAKPARATRLDSLYTSGAARCERRPRDPRRSDSMSATHPIEACLTDGGA